MQGKSVLWLASQLYLTCTSPRLILTSPKKLLMSNSYSGKVVDLGESPRRPTPTPLIFRSNRKNFFGDRPPSPLSQGLNDRPPPPYLKVWIRHCDRQVYDMLYQPNSKNHQPWACQTLLSLHAGVAHSALINFIGLASWLTMQSWTRYQLIVLS